MQYDLERSILVITAQYCTMFSGSRAVLTPNVTCHATEDAVRFVNLFYFNPNHT
jgi:hypothetical protein